MKKTILGLAFLTIFGTSFSAFAQSQSNTCNQKECMNKECKGKQDCKDNKDCCKKQKDGKLKKDIKRGDKQAALFEGIVLSDVQKEKIKALNEGTRISRQEMAQAKKDGKNLKSKLNKDSKDALNQANLAKKEMRKERQELRAKYLKDMSEILDHEQYVKFLQNYYVSNPQHHAVAHGPKGMKAHKGKRDGKNMRGFHDRRNAVSPQTNS